MPTQIGFSRPIKFNPWSWMVRKITGSECSHTWFLYYDEAWKCEMVLEATDFAGFRIQSFEKFKRKNYIVATFLPRKDIEQGLQKVAVEFLGSRYDFAGFFGMAWVMFNNWLRRKAKNPLRTSKNVFCSEAVTLAFQWSPEYEQFRTDPETVSPQDLLNLFRSGQL